VRVHPSALRHGVASEDAVQAAEWAVWIEPLTDDESPGRELRLRFDTHARLLETIIVVFDSGDEMVITPCPPERSTSTYCPSASSSSVSDGDRDGADPESRCHHGGLGVPCRAKTMVRTCVANGQVPLRTRGRPLTCTFVRIWVEPDLNPHKRRSLFEISSRRA
jgi:hypothetical protein